MDSPHTGALSAGRGRRHGHIGELMSDPTPAPPFDGTSFFAPVKRAKITQGLVAVWQLFASPRSLPVVQKRLGYSIGR
jgi:hypothetical protein